MTLTLIFWGSLKNRLLGEGGGGLRKNQNRGEDCLQRGRGAQTVCRFEGGWARGGVFLRGEGALIPNAHYGSNSLNNWLITVNIFSNIFIITRFEVVSLFTFTDVVSSLPAVHLKKYFLSCQFICFVSMLQLRNAMTSFACGQNKEHSDLQKVSLSKYYF